jgi:hypothetical protein
MEALRRQGGTAGDPMKDRYPSSCRPEIDAYTTFRSMTGNCTSKRRASARRDASGIGWWQSTNPSLTLSRRGSTSIAVASTVARWLQAQWASWSSLFGKSTAMNSAAIRPFRFSAPEPELTEMRRRISATQWPDRETVSDQSQGPPLATLQKLARYWVTEYDWRKVEARLNALPNFVTEIDGLDIHFIHVRS